MERVRSRRALGALQRILQLGATHLRIFIDFNTVDDGTPGGVK